MENLLIALGQVQDELNSIIRALKESTVVKDELSDPREYVLAKAKILELTLKPVQCN
jgi:hypothetical protein